MSSTSTRIFRSSGRIRMKNMGYAQIHTRIFGICSLLSKIAASPCLFVYKPRIWNVIGWPCYTLQPVAEAFQDLGRDVCQQQFHPDHLSGVDVDRGERAIWGIRMKLRQVTATASSQNASGSCMLLLRVQRDTKSIWVIFGVCLGCFRMFPLYRRLWLLLLLLLLRLLPPPSSSSFSSS